MDVRCNRCATEYDFDDALISERGTTVKCTNCGYQFKVFPATPQLGAPDRWVVRTAEGKEIVYTSLRELQRGIAERQVGPDDLLSRGRQPPRPLGAIAELEPFFSGNVSASRPARTIHGVAPAPRPGVGPLASAASASARAPATPPAPTTTLEGLAPLTPTPMTGEAYAPTMPAGRMNVGAAVPRPARRGPGDTLPGPSTELMPPPASEARPVETGFGVGVPAPAPAFVTTTRSAGVEPSSVRSAAVAPASARSVAMGPASVRGQLPSSPSASSPDEPRPQLASSPSSAEYRPPLGSSPFSERNPYAAARREQRSYDELTQDEMVEGGRRARSRWIAAVVILGLTTLFAVTVGRRYLVAVAAPGTASSASSDAKVANLLREGNRLIDEGDLEGAGEPLLRASALADKDRAVLAALARLQTVRADITWLKLRLLDPKATDLVQTTHGELGRRVGRARKATDDAFAVAPEDLVVLRARVDTLRLSGEADKAREWLRPIASNTSDPQNAYVLAALDLADEQPSWPSVVDRLRTAASGERIPGRAHVALVYALVRSGQLTEAQAEIAKLDASPSALLLEELKSFAKRFAAGAAPGPSANDPRKSKLDGAAASADPARPAAPLGDDARIVDFRRALADASAALRRGNLGEAEQLYNRVVAGQPGNTEALSGLADIARRRNNGAEAARLYDRVIAENPSYLPALLARADQQWDSGNKKAALVLYHRVLDQSGTGTEYGRRAQQRIAQAGAEKPVEAKSESDSAPAAPPPAAPPPAAPPSGIDTTDLPELK
jgi:predicted Zn finger-like uncharacterized protein